MVAGEEALELHRKRLSFERSRKVNRFARSPFLLCLGFASMVSGVLWSVYY
jgi:hypothetical protein